MNFDWSGAAGILSAFGGDDIALHVPKTGLPYFDALQLYGAIDLYIGLREDVFVHDAGSKWLVNGRSRAHRLAQRDESAFARVWQNKKPNPEEYCNNLRRLISDGTPSNDAPFVNGRGDWDAALQDGIRGVSARAYETLQSGQTSKQECKAAVPLSQALLAFAGMKRTEGIGDITFLPIFEGHVDFSKVVSPMRAWLRPPHILCSQALMLLALQTSLFSEGYQKVLRGVVFNTEFDSRKHTNCSGFVTIDSTAIGRIESPDFAGHTYRTFLTLVQNAWEGTGRTKRLYPAALAMTYWLMQPSSKHLSAMITSQEILRRESLGQIFTRPEFVKEVFNMTYGDWNGDFMAVQQLAKAVASAIYSARMNKREYTFEDKRKAWYDEVTMLRSAPTAKAFVERVMILIEQGRREYSRIGTEQEGEAFDPKTLFASIGSDRTSFETFRDLFRMYLVQASTYDSRKAGAIGEAIAATDGVENKTGEEEETI